MLTVQAVQYEIQKSELCCLPRFQTAAVAKGQPQASFGFKAREIVAEFLQMKQGGGRLQIKINNRNKVFALKDKKNEVHVPDFSCKYGWY